MSVQYNPRRKTHFVRWIDDQDRHRNKTFPGTKQGKRDAQAFDFDIKSRKKSGRDLPRPNQDAMYLDELSQLWINAKIAQGRSPGWIRDWASIIKHRFIPHLTYKPVQEFTYDELVVFVTQTYPKLATKKKGKPRKLSQSTTNRYLNYLKMMFNFGLEHEHIHRNPLRRWKTPKEPPRQTMLTVADLRNIKEHAPPHLQWAIELEWNLGTRAGVSELLSLQWQMIDWDESYIRVYGQKTRTWRKIPLDSGLLEELRRRKKKAATQYLVEYNGKQIKKFHRSLATACKKAGITYNVRLTDIRHLFVTTLLSGGADLKAVSEIIGHSSTKMTVDQYYFSLEGEKRKAVASLPSLDDSVATFVATNCHKKHQNDHK